VGKIVTISNNDKQKHKEYAQYAELCLTTAPTTTNENASALNREMAAEWLKLIDAIFHPFDPMKSK
jgi:hypothetical protein